MGGMPDGAQGAEPVIRVDGLEKRYRNGTQALRGISFSIGKGETFGLLGPNGAGKTTAIGVLTTLVEPTGGSATVLGLDVTRNPMRVKRLLGVVPQERWLDEDVTARENLLLHGEYYGMPKKERAMAAERVLGMMELSQRADDSLYSYSGGMLQRLLIARALMHEPPILIMDEPPIGLDPQARHHMWDYITELKRQGVTILLTTHYMDEAERLCDRVAIIDEGVIKAIDSPENLKKLLPGVGTIVADVSPITDDLLSELKAVKGVRTLKSENGSLTLFVEDGKHLLPRIVELIQKRAELRAVTVQEPTLEDVYIHLTGKGLRA